MHHRCVRPLTLNRWRGCIQPHAAYVINMLSTFTTQALSVWFDQQTEFITLMTIKVQLLKSLWSQLVTLLVGANNDKPGGDFLNLTSLLSADTAFNNTSFTREGFRVEWGNKWVKRYQKTGKVCTHIHSEKVCSPWHLDSSGWTLGTGLQGQSTIFISSVSLWILHLKNLYSWLRPQSTWGGEVEK